MARVGPISPVSLFPFKTNRCIPLQLDWKSQVITLGPESLLLERSSTSRLSLGESLRKEESSPLFERLRDFKLEQEPKLEMSEREPEREFRERSKVVKKVLHLVKEMVPVRLISFRTRVSRWSRERRKVETRLKLVPRWVKLRSMEDTKESLQVMPVKLHVFWFGSQLERRVGFDTLALKLRSCWVSL